MKRYIILAGVNGAGKSTLYYLMPSLNEIEKINLDDTARELGDWNNPRIVISAAAVVLKKLIIVLQTGCH